MMKSDLVKAISENAYITQKGAFQALDALLNTIGESLKQGKAVTFFGFGSFRVLEKPARQGFNPRTGKNHFHSGKNSAEIYRCKGFKGSSEVMIHKQNPNFYPTYPLNRLLQNLVTPCLL